MCYKSLLGFGMSGIRIQWHIVCSNFFSGCLQTFIILCLNVFTLSGEKSDAKKNTTSRSRQDDLLHAADIMGPGSPAGASADQQASSASQQDIAAIAAAPELSADMQKFITFAGSHVLLFVAAHS